jgi:hypothetical protein
VTGSDVETNHVSQRRERDRREYQTKQGDLSSEGWRIGDPEKGFIFYSKSSVFWEVRKENSSTSSRFE